MLKLLAVASIFASIAYGVYFTVKPVSWLRSLIKTIPVGALCLIGFLLDTPVLLTLALLFGTIGDFALSRAGDRNFLIGLASFLLGHICLVGLFGQLGSSISGIQTSGIGLVVGVVFSSLALGVFMHIKKHLGPMHLPVAAYVFVSWLLGMLALQAINQENLVFAVIGTLLFIVSDIVLAYDLFVIPTPSTLRHYTSRTLWFLYWSGQAMILYGVYQAGL